MAQEVEIFPDFLDQDSTQVALKLLGCTLTRTINGNTVKVRIVETESYDETDAASHSFKGRTDRTDIMFGPSGHLYVYFTYGMHYCCNVVTGPENEGSAVLIRAVEPLLGVEYISQFRSKAGYELSNGPAKLCQALQIDKSLNGHDLHQSPLVLNVGNDVAEKDIVTAVRIGISRDKDARRRFYIKGNPYVSK